MCYAHPTLTENIDGSDAEQTAITVAIGAMAEATDDIPLIDEKEAAHQPQSA